MPEYIIMWTSKTDSIVEADTPEGAVNKFLDKFGVDSRSEEFYAIEVTKKLSKYKLEARKV